jgi:hypothetical protein
MNHQDVENIRRNARASFAIGVILIALFLFAFLASVLYALVAIILYLF